MLKHISHFLPRYENVDMKETEAQFSLYPSVSKGQQVESHIEGISIDYGHFGGSGAIHRNLLEVETEEERRDNPY